MVWPGPVICQPARTEESLGLLERREGKPRGACK
jgi:hypothetical protein